MDNKNAEIKMKMKFKLLKKKVSHRKPQNFSPPIFLSLFLRWTSSLAFVGAAFDFSIKAHFHEFYKRTTILIEEMLSEW